MFKFTNLLLSAMFVLLILCVKCDNNFVGKSKRVRRNIGGWSTYNSDRGVLPAKFNGTMNKNFTESQTAYPYSRSGLSGSNGLPMNTRAEVNKTFLVRHPSYSYNRERLSGTSGLSTNTREKVNKTVPVNNSSYPHNRVGLSGSSGLPTDTREKVNKTISINHLSYSYNREGVNSLPINIRDNLNKTLSENRPTYPYNRGGLSGDESVSISHPTSSSSRYEIRGTSFTKTGIEKIMTHRTDTGRPMNTGLNDSKKRGFTKIYLDRHYRYSPPSAINYGSPGYLRNYPVYSGRLPSNVYEYRNSGSKYSILLSGLGLLNLGLLQNSGLYHDPDSNYKPALGEVCKFGLLENNSTYEESLIDCDLITYFINKERESVTNNKNFLEPKKTNGITSNGNLVPLNLTAPEGGSMQNLSPNGTVMSTMALKFAINEKGRDITVTPRMQCFVIRTTPMTVMKRPVLCGLLQAYAKQSLKLNSATRPIPTFITLIAIVTWIKNNY